MLSRVKSPPPRTKESFGLTVYPVVLIATSITTVIVVLFGLLSLL